MLYNFSICSSCLTDTSSKEDVQEALAQACDLVLEYMKTNTDTVIESSTRAIMFWFSLWLSQNYGSNASANVRALQSQVTNFVSRQRSKSWFREVKKRKVDQISQLHFEREAKIQKMDTTPSMEFFSDPHLFVQIMDYLGLGDLIHLRNSCRFALHTLEQFGLLLLQKFNTSIEVSFCSQTQRANFNSRNSDVYKIRCILAGVSKDKIGQLIINSKTNSITNKKYVGLTEFMIETLPLFQDCTLLRLTHQHLNPKTHAYCTTQQLQGYSMIRYFTVDSEPILDEFPDQRIFFHKRFEKDIRDPETWFFGTIRNCNELIRTNEHAEEKMIIWFVQGIISIQALSWSTFVPLNKKVLLYVLDYEHLFVVQGNQLYKMFRNTTFRALKGTSQCKMMNSRYFLDNSIQRECFQEPKDDKEEEFLCKLQQVYIALDPFIGLM